jgi:hypothetical protein
MKVKAWTWVNQGGRLTSAIWMHKKSEAMAVCRTWEKVVPCTITYSLPKRRSK